MRLFPLVALTAAGLLWGSTVPLTKVVLPWLGPAWLTVIRFALAALLLAVILLTGPVRRHLRGALSPGVIVSGAAGYGLIVTLQNIGVQHTSVSHAALLGGAIPVLVAMLTTVLCRGGLGMPREPASRLLRRVGGTRSTAGARQPVRGTPLLLAGPPPGGFLLSQPRPLGGHLPGPRHHFSFLRPRLCPPLPSAEGFRVPSTLPKESGVSSSGAGLPHGVTWAPFSVPI